MIRAPRVTSDAVTGDSTGALLEPRLVGDIQDAFFVPAYQRGYRWGTTEVARLLDDVHESEGEPYFLQPIVVKSRPDGRWELVDGQQRLTTLYLILKYMHDPQVEPWLLPLAAGALLASVGESVSVPPRPPDCR